MNITIEIAMIRVMNRIPFQCEGIRKRPEVGIGRKLNQDNATGPPKSCNNERTRRRGND